MTELDLTNVESITQDHPFTDYEMLKLEAYDYHITQQEDGSWTARRRPSLLIQAVNRHPPILTS